MSNCIRFHDHTTDSTPKSRLWSCLLCLMLHILPAITLFLFHTISSHTIPPYALPCYLAIPYASADPPLPPRTLATLVLTLSGFSATRPAQHTWVLEAQHRQPKYHFEGSFKNRHSAIQSLHRLLLHHIRSSAFLLGSPRWLLSLALRCVALTQP
jgi:hypothetical protein